MALLDHAVTLTCGRRRIDEAEAWCHARWPHTHGATWTMGSVEQAGLAFHHHNGQWPYRRTWRFQRPEDAMLFKLAWCWS